MIDWDFNVVYNNVSAGGTSRGNYVYRASFVGAQLGLRGIAMNFEVEESHELYELQSILDEQAAGLGALGGSSSSGRQNIKIGKRSNERPRELFRQKFFNFVRECDEGNKLSSNALPSGDHDGKSKNKTTSSYAEVLKRLTLVHDGSPGRSDVLEKICNRIAESENLSSASMNSRVAPSCTGSAAAAGNLNPGNQEGPELKKPRLDQERSSASNSIVQVLGDNLMQQPASVGNKRDFCDFLVALRPTTETALQQIAAAKRFTNFRVLSLPLEDRIGVRMLRPQATSLLAKSVLFEVCLSHSLRAEQEVRFFFANVQKIARLTHAKHCLVVSGARDLLELRSGDDLENFAKVLDIKQSARTNEALRKSDQVVGRAIVQC
ncbi:unnamed protein product [Amoebophrya sp. A25]|nr:unnamed protein product [Amoebophrya sp. A25]|eukprot:GSA25T00007758001.1